MDKSTSEEKLLSVIRKKDQKKSKKAKGARFSLGSKINGFDFLNKVFIIAILVCIGYIIVTSVVRQSKDVDALLSKAEKASIESEEGPQKAVKVIAFSQYAGKFEKRDIFNTSFKKSKVVQTSPVVPKQNPMQSLKLVGIVLDDEPQAIVEDSTSNQTVFLIKGDTINGAILEQIEESKVIFRYNGEEFELAQ